MIRMIQRRLIIPRGDTGSFSIPCLKTMTNTDVAVFTIFDNITHTKIFQKLINREGDNLTISFSHNETVNLKPGKYLWDIKIYSNPQFLDEELINGEQVDSYYAGFSLPECEIKETGDNWLMAENDGLSPTQLNLISALFSELNNAISQVQATNSHFAKIVDDTWYVWDNEHQNYVSTGVKAVQDLTEYAKLSDIEPLSTEELDNIIGGN